MQKAATMTNRPSLALLIAILLYASQLSAQEWTRFRGPNGSGLSDAQNIPATWTEQDYNWKVELPAGGHSSPVLWGDKIFLTGADETTSKRMAFCLDTSGKLLWQQPFDFAPHKKHALNSFATATPAVDDKHVYIVWSTPEEYTLLALNHAGKEVWRRNLGPYDSQHSCGSSPIVYENMVILGNDQDGPSSLIALDRETGKTVWQVDRRSANVAYSTPVVHERTGEQPELIFNSGAHGITAVNPLSGETKWEVADLFDKRSVSSPVLAGGLIFGSCGSGGGGNYVVAVRPGGQQSKAEFAYKIDKSAPYVPTPIAKDDLIFFWSDQGVVTCAYAATGDIRWRERVGGNYFGSPIYIGDRLYCISTEGEVAVLSASDNYQMVGRNPLGELSHSTPAVADGRLYLRTFTHLVSIGGEEAAGK